MINKMKIWGVFMLTILAFTGNTSGQGVEMPLDSNWYIKKKVIEGGETMTLFLKNGDYKPLPPSKNVTIKGIGLPNKDCVVSAKDDIFIIFEDSSYYSSRAVIATEKDNIPTVVRGNTFVTIEGERQQSQTKEYGEDNKLYGEIMPLSNFIDSDSRTPGRRSENISNESTYLSYKNTPSPIAYLYATDVYDDDPPPEKINVTNTSQTVYNTISRTQSDKILSASHDISMGDDITIIINRRAILNKIGNKPFKKDTPLILKYKRVQYFNNLLNPVNIQGELFISRPIFVLEDESLSASFPSFNEVEGSETIINNFDTDYLYINLRPIRGFPQNLLPSMTGSCDDSGKLRVNKVLFELFNGKELIDTLAEDIRHSNDPNSISAIEICKNKDGSQYVKYRCIFQNNTRVEAGNLKVQFTLPNGLDKDSIKILHSYVNGERINLSYLSHNTTGNIISIMWDDTIKIHACPNDCGEGKVEVTFCVKKKNDSNIGLRTAPLTTGNAKTFFTTGGETTSYDLEYFDQFCKLEKNQTTPYNTKEIICERIFKDNCNKCSSQKLEFFPKKKKQKSSKRSKNAGQKKSKKSKNKR